MTQLQKPTKTQSPRTGARESFTEPQAVKSESAIWTQSDLFAQPMEALPVGEKDLKQSDPRIQPHDADPNVRPKLSVSQAIKSTSTEETRIVVFIPTPAGTGDQEEGGRVDRPQNAAESGGKNIGIASASSANGVDSPNVATVLDSPAPYSPSAVYVTEIMDVVPAPTIADGQDGRLTDLYHLSDNATIATAEAVRTDPHEPTKTASEPPSLDATADTLNSSQLAPSFLEPCCARAISSPNTGNILDAIASEQENKTTDQSPAEIRSCKLRDLQIHPAVPRLLELHELKPLWDALWETHKDAPWFLTPEGASVLLEHNEFRGVMIDGHLRIHTNTWILRHAQEICEPNTSISVQVQQAVSDAEVERALIAEYALRATLYILPHKGKTLRMLRRIYSQISRLSGYISGVTVDRFSQWFQCGIRNLHLPKKEA